MKTSKAKTGARQRRGKSIESVPQGGSAGSEILAAIEEATEILRSEGLRSKRVTVREYKVAPVPHRYRPGDVKRLRERLGVSQAVLAAFLGINVNTVRAWEQGKRPPQPIACRFLAEIEADPVYWQRRIEPEAFESASAKKSPSSRETTPGAPTCSD
jgi:putative transcriptional regulator